MVDKEKLAEEITTGEGIGKYMDKPLRIANFLLGYEKAEELYKKQIQDLTIQLEVAKEVNWQKAFDEQYELRKNSYEREDELKEELQTATNLLIRLKNLHYQGDVTQTPLYKDIWEFLKDKEYSCSKNGIKKEGESCTLNNNCIYPKCLK